MAVFKKQKMLSVGENVEERELCRTGRNLSWCNCCGTQNGGSAKNVCQLIFFFRVGGFLFIDVPLNFPLQFLSHLSPKVKGRNCWGHKPLGSKKENRKQSNHWQGRD
jgi:hypothetical protein